MLYISNETKYIKMVRVFERKKIEKTIKYSRK